MGRKRACLINLSVPLPNPNNVRTLVESVIKLCERLRSTLSGLSAVIKQVVFITPIYKKTCEKCPQIESVFWSFLPAN